MRVRVVGAARRLSVCANASAIEPWLNIAALPDSITRAFGVPLSRVILAFRVLRPIKCKTVTHKLFAEISAADRTCCDRSPVWVEIERHATDGAGGNEAIKVVGGLRATAIR
jgi:hypothetical protein